MPCNKIEIEIEILYLILVSSRELMKNKGRWSSLAWIDISYEGLVERKIKSENMGIIYHVICKIRLNRLFLKLVISRLF